MEAAAAHEDLDQRLIMEMLANPSQDEDSRSILSGSTDSNHSNMTYNPYEFHTFKIKFDGVNGVKGEVINIDLPRENEETEVVTKSEVNGESEAVPDVSPSSDTINENVETPDEGREKEEGSAQENETNNESVEKKTEENQESAEESPEKVEENQEVEEKSPEKVEENQEVEENEEKVEESQEPEGKEEEKDEEEPKDVEVESSKEENSPPPEEEEEAEGKKEVEKSEDEEKESDEESPQSEKSQDE